MMNLHSYIANIFRSSIALAYTFFFTKYSFYTFLIAYFSGVDSFFCLFFKWPKYTTPNPPSPNLASISKSSNCIFFFNFAFLSRIFSISSSVNSSS